MFSSMPPYQRGLDRNFGPFCEKHPTPSPFARQAFWRMASSSRMPASIPPIFWRIIIRILKNDSTSLKSFRPNVSSLIITNAMLNVAFALVAFSSLSFLGVGVPPGSADWGRQLTDGRSIMMDNPAAVLVPTLLIIGVACAANLVGDWLGQTMTRSGRA